MVASAFGLSNDHNTEAANPMPGYRRVLDPPPYWVKFVRPILAAGCFERVRPAESLLECADDNRYDDFGRTGAQLDRPDGDIFWLLALEAAHQIADDRYVADA
jgi:hypothetical protein